MYLFVGIIGLFVMLEKLIQEAQSQISLFVGRIQLDTLLRIGFAQPVALVLNMRKSPIRVVNCQLIGREIFTFISQTNGLSVGLDRRVKFKLLQQVVSSLLVLFTSGKIVVHNQINDAKIILIQQTQNLIMSRAPSYAQQISEEKNKSCLASVGEFLKKFNPCLRPQVQSETLTKYLENFEEVSVYQDPYFGECFLLESKSFGELVILKKQIVYENEIVSRQRKISQLQAFNGNPHVVNQSLVQKLLKLGFLWAKYELYLSYDYIFIDLQKQFEYRISQNRGFEESQVISIMKGTCKGLIHLQSTPYSSVRMCYIYFTKDGTVKLAHPQLFSYKSNLANICENDEESGIYLSPEEMKCLERGDKDVVNGWKSNCYALGMVFLSLMAKEHLDEVYDYSACSIEEYKIAQVAKSCKQFYSERLVNIVEKMVMQRPDDRLTLRSVLNKLSYKLEEQKKIDIELIEEAHRGKNNDFYPESNYQPIREQLQHPNFLRGIVFPKVGRIGEYYDDKEEGTSDLYQHKQNVHQPNNQAVTAQQRFFYANRNSQYIGEGVQKHNPNLKKDEQYFKQKPTREGKGLYTNADGQQYLGEWVKGEMEGHGKLFWNQKQIRYEGEFKQGKFHGRGTEYNGKSDIVGVADPEDEPDETFVRMQKDNWQKYEGNFWNDEREGQGIVYFRCGRWMGNFKNGQPNGEGVFIRTTGERTKGQWKDGILRE